MPSLPVLGTLAYAERPAREHVYPDGEHVPVAYVGPVKVFLSWSDTKSRAVALAVADWLPSVINSVEPFVSADIHAGLRWQNEIAEQLATTASESSASPESTNTPRG